MLIKKIENNGITESYYDSTNILKSEYNKPKNELTIIFSYGGKYIYENVTLSDFTRFEMADSQGQVLNSHIKPTHSFINSGKINPDDIKKEIKAINEAEIKDLEEGIKFKANVLSLNFTTTNLDDLLSTIKLYQTKVRK